MQAPSPNASDGSVGDECRNTRLRASTPVHSHRWYMDYHIIMPYSSHIADTCASQHSMTGSVRRQTYSTAAYSLCGSHACQAQLRRRCNIDIAMRDTSLSGSQYAAPLPMVRGKPPQHSSRCLLSRACRAASTSGASFMHRQNTQSSEAMHADNSKKVGDLHHRQSWAQMHSRHRCYLTCPHGRSGPHVSRPAQ